VDPFPRRPGRGAPGARTIVPTKPAPPPKPPAVTPREALQIGQYVNRQVSGTAREAVRDAMLYTYPFPPGEGPPGVGKPQKKLIEDLGGLLLPKTYFKALTEIGEGSIPLVKRTSGPGLGLGVGEEDAIFQITERERQFRERFQAELLSRPQPRASAGKVRPPFPPAVAPGSLQPTHVRPVNAAAIANEAAAEGLRAALVHERADP
jgi:hypothetical protein